MRKHLLGYVLIAAALVTTWAATAAIAQPRDNEAQGADLQDDIAALQESLKSTQIELNTLKTELKQLRTALSEGIVTKRLLVTKDVESAGEAMKRLDPGTARTNNLDTQWLAVWDNDWKQIGSALEYRTLRTNGIRLDDYVEYGPAAFGPQWARDKNLAQGSTRIGMAADSGGTTELFMNHAAQAGRAWTLSSSKNDDGKMVVAHTHASNSTITLQDNGTINFGSSGTLAMYQSIDGVTHSFVHLYGHPSGSGLYLGGDKVAKVVKNEKGEDVKVYVKGFLGCHKNHPFEVRYMNE